MVITGFSEGYEVNEICDRTIIISKSYSVSRNPDDHSKRIDPVMTSYPYMPVNRSINSYYFDGSVTIIYSVSRPCFGLA